MALVSSSAPVPTRRSQPGGLREVIALATPVIVTQISATLMGVVDSAMVGRLGATELAAAGFGSVWLWTLFSIFVGTASGVQTFVSQHDGAGEPERCGAWVWHGFASVVPAALLLAAISYVWVGPALALLDTSAELQLAAQQYATARLPGEAGFAVSMLLTSFFRGIGDTRTPMWTTLFANLVNAVLDYGLIFGRLGLPEWGIAGAGAATAVANWLGVAVLLGLMLRRAMRARYRTAPSRVSPSEIARFLRTGAPIGGQWCVGMTSFAVFTTVVARMGDASMAASQAFVMLLSLSFMQAVGISVAASTLVGRYRGAAANAAAERSFRSSMQLGIGLAAWIALLFVAIPGPLLRIFSNDADVLTLGRPLLLIGALFQLFDAVAIIAEGALRGAGDTRWPFVVETAFGWGLFLPLAWFLGVALDGGLTGAWLGALISIACSSAVLVWRFRSRAWQRIAI